MYTHCSHDCEVGKNRREEKSLFEQLQSRIAIGVLIPEKLNHSGCSSSLQGRSPLEHFSTTHTDREQMYTTQLRN